MDDLFSWITAKVFFSSLVTVKGKGNFNQLVAPVINWPSGTEGFEPSITDLLDKSVKPLEGSRTFRYAFVASKPGSYLLPAISFSFFDPDSNKYKRNESSQQSFTVTDSGVVLILFSKISIPGNGVGSSSSNTPSMISCSAFLFTVLRENSTLFFISMASTI